MAARTVHSSLPIALDRTSPVPLYHQLFKQISSAIASGALRPGDALEREDLLAQRLRISRPTLRRALSALADAGLISRSRGTGTTVSPLQVDQDQPHVAVRSGGPARTTSRILRLDPDCVDRAAAGELGLEEDCRLVYIEKLIVVDGGSIAIQRTWLPATVLDPSERDLAASPIRSILRDMGRAISAERRTFTLRTADDRERAVFGGNELSLVHEVCAIGYDARANVVEFTISSFLDGSEGGLLEAS